MDYTLEIQPAMEPGFLRVIVTFSGGVRAETTVKGEEAQARWFAEHAFIPDLRRLYPDRIPDPEAQSPVPGGEML